MSLEQSSTMAVTWLRQWGSLDSPEPMILLMYEIAPIDTGNNTVVFRTIPTFRSSSSINRVSVSALHILCVS